MAPGGLRYKGLRRYQERAEFVADAESLTDNLFKSLVDPPPGSSWFITGESYL